LVIIAGVIISVNPQGPREFPQPALLMGPCGSPRIAVPRRFDPSKFCPTSCGKRRNSILHPACRNASPPYIRAMPDLFDTPPAKPGDSYSAKDIEVLEGLEPVRRRPGMYVGGADELEVEVARDRKLWSQSYCRGIPKTSLGDRGPVHNRRGTTVRFHPDPEIFGELGFRPATLYRMARSKAYLFRGLEIRWSCDP